MFGIKFTEIKFDDDVAVSVTVPVCPAAHVIINPKNVVPPGVVVPVVDPPDGTVTVTKFLVELNVAVTAVAALTVTTHAPVPLQAPPQPAKTEPSAALCVNVTCVPLAKLAAQVSGQIIPAGVLFTVPLPVPASVTVNVKLLTLAVKFAVTAVDAVNVTTHVPVPSHGPAPQPANVDPLVGAAVNVTAVPLAKPAAQLVGQLIPAGALVTVPVPVPASVMVNVGFAAAVPVPVNPTFCGLVTALSVIVSVPLKAVAVVGVNVTLIVHVPAGAIGFAVQVFVSANGALTTTLGTVRFPLPVLVTVMVCAALVVFTAWFPNGSVEGATITVAVTPPVSPNICKP